MTKVLVPIDGSGTALRALRYAMGMAEEIHIVNVQDKADAPVLLLHMTEPEIEKMQLDYCRSMLADARKVLDAAGRPPYQAHLLIGDPAATIVRVARSENVDQIVMGTRGMGALGNLMLGSIATKVIHLAETPVTLVK